MIDENGTRFWISRAENLTNYNYSNKLDSNASFTRAFTLRSSGGYYVADLGTKFGSSLNSSMIDAMSITKTTDGRYVIFANSRSSIISGMSGHIFVVATRDFVTYEGPWVYSTLFGAGHSIRVAQPNKNGSSAINKVHFFHGGDLYQRDGSSDGNWGLIEYSQFKYYKMVLH